MTGIVILNYKTFQDTIRLVRELQQQTVAAELYIVVVDNASPNDSYEKLRFLEEEFPNVAVLQTEENLGYAKGNNFGLKYLEEIVKPDYAAILNNDVFLPENCFEYLAMRYRELSNPGVIAPLMLDAQGQRILLPHTLNNFTQDCLNLFYIPRLIINKRRKLAYDKIEEKEIIVDIVPGSFMFFKFETFKEMGYFYPHTFLYAEERFITARTKLLKLKNYILQDLTYIHAHNSPTISSVYNTTEKYKMLYDSILKFTQAYRKHGKLKAAIMKPFTVYSLWEIRIIQSIIRHK